MASPGLLALAAVASEYLAALAVVLLAVLGSGWRRIAWTGVAGAAAATVFSWLALAAGEGRLSYPWVPGLGVDLALRVDALSGIVGVVVSTLSLLIALYSVDYIGEWGAARYWLFYSFFVASMLLLVYADDLVVMFIGWEGTGLSSWALISFYHDDREEAWVGDPGRSRLGVPMWFTPTHSGLRALSFTRLGDMGMLIGMGLVAASLGSTSMSGMEGHAAWLLSDLNMRGLLAAWLALFYLGALAKSAQFPFHEWLVTAMTGPTSVSALIHAATMVKAGVYFALRFTPAIAAGLALFHGAGAGVYRGLAWLALLTAFSTATMAIVARELKLILAFSTASQLSYMMAAVFAAAAAGSPALGSLGGLAHLISHAVFKAALFLAAGAVIHEVGSRYITDMGGLRRSMPYTFLAFLLAGLSLAALPPFSGWWSKDLAVEAIGLLGGWASLAALATAVLTAFYTVRMIYYVFLAPPRGERHAGEPGWLMLGPYLALGLASLGLGLAWPWLARLLEEAVGLHAFREELGVVAYGTLAAALGASGILLYRARLLPLRGVEERPLLGALHGFLYDRWLVNPLIYRLVVYPGAWLSRALARVEELLDLAVHGGVARAGWRMIGALQEGAELRLDRALHVELPAAAAGLSAAVRRLQSGDVRIYIVYFMAGMVLAAILSTVVIFFIAHAAWPALASLAPGW
ncbi:hypothetical protein CF15_04645 [Pyrodictium occultum]|uniref:NADH-quinone oxidoreductase subunit L n=1 Tax=Pyrodictium occultum TaxID=2309 RepID=A0A0V8RVI4_PYROC|nr:NADH-quinone oxidoreductase subunit L [Pyrodictium occultum]KSW12070.1 hypothetical protein CF15_04645 [Pyrodictium occultum]